MIAADWWNPVTWLQTVGGFFQGAYSAGGAVLNVLGGVLTILTQFFRFFFDTGHFISDAVNWITNTIFPPELQTWFLGTVSSPGNQANSTQIYESLYRGMAAPALMIAAVAAAGRIIRALADHRTGAMDTTLSVIPRFLIAVAVIGVPGTSVSLGYAAIVWAINASVAVAGAVVGMILNTSFLSTMTPGEGWFSHVLAVLAATSHDMVAVVLGGIPLLILILYAAFLMVVRTVMLGFCVVTAPLCFATAVFDSNNRFFHWWLDLLGSVLLTPLVLGIAIALSLTLASHVVSSLVVGPLLAMVIMGGCTGPSDWRYPAVSSTSSLFVLVAIAGPSQSKRFGITRPDVFPDRVGPITRTLVSLWVTSLRRRWVPTKKTPTRPRWGRMSRRSAPRAQCAVRTMRRCTRRPGVWPFARCRMPKAKPHAITTITADVTQNTEPDTGLLGSTSIHHRYAPPSEPTRRSDSSRIKEVERRRARSPTRHERGSCEDRPRAEPERDECDCRTNVTPCLDSVWVGCGHWHAHFRARVWTRPGQWQLQRLCRGAARAIQQWLTPRLR